MNLKNQSIEKLDSSSCFNKNILNPFLEESKYYYPNSIISSKKDSLNITLLKNFPKNKYNFKYEDSINLIFNYLKELIKEYGLNEIYLYENLKYGFNPSVKIIVPKNVSSKDITKYSDEIYGKVGDFAELKHIEFILDDLSIILCR